MNRNAKSNFQRKKSMPLRPALKLAGLMLCFSLCLGGAVQAGQFDYVTQWGFICPSLFGCPAPNGFWGSSDIVVTPNGTVYVYDLLNNRIHQYDTDGNFQGHLVTCPDWNPQTEDYCTDEGEINYSPSMAVSPGGEYLYVSDPRSFRIHKFDTDGNWILSWGNLESVPVFFREPSGVAVDADGLVYVTDILGSSILKLDADGLLLEMWTHPYASGNDFRPTGIFAADAGIYVTDYMNSVLYLFDYRGRIVDSWGLGDGTAPGEFIYPSDVAVDAAGNVFVADTLNNRIQSLSDEMWSAYGGGAEGSINRPFGIATDSAGNVYVADTFNNRVVKYAYTP